MGKRLESTFLPRRHTDDNKHMKSYSASDIRENVNQNHKISPPPLGRLEFF